MKHRPRSAQRLWLWLSFCLLTISASSSVSATAQCDEWVARIISVQGQVEAKTAHENRWKNVEQGQRYCANDMIHVRENSRAALELANETIIRLDQNTTIVLSGESEEASWLDLLKGAVHFITRTPNALKIKTPYVNAAVEGTEFVIRVENGETIVSVIEGRVALENEQGALLLTNGQSASARAGEAPLRRLDIRPEDAVQWSLYYPSIIDRSALRAHPLTLEADRLLSVGRAAEARALLDKIVQLRPDSAAAYAMQSIIALTQNRNDEALVLATQAFALNPTTPTTAIALSYAQQAQFDLRAARNTLQHALHITPDSSLLLARQAELLLSLDDLDQAERMAQQALGINPEQAHALTILGFAHLGQFNTQRARRYFEQAINLDQASPLPRLGIGLALIRDGALGDGRREIEIAATLSPANALIRSYLGKAYYEEKRNDLAADQFMLAKSLDPNDPTPWFYDAIRKQTLNNPVGALQDLQQSIQLNDNRAVYRSRMLLDQDQAARSSSLARIYNDLGFQQLALSEGWKSLNTDPGNHSAHRLLADSYSVLPRHEIARVSELLQSQLLQPLNLNPIQPQLAESSLGILDGAGPTSATANEFNPLFTRNRFSLQLNGIAAQQDSEQRHGQDYTTRSSDLVHAAVIGRYSYSVGTFRDDNEGIRPNQDRGRRIDNLFLQAALSHKTSVQFEYRDTQISQGDLPLRYAPSLFSSSERRFIDSRVLRLGMRHDFSPGNTLLFSAINNGYEEHTRDNAALNLAPPSGTVPRSLTVDLSESGQTFELQHHLFKKGYSIISGAGTYRSDKNQIIDVNFPTPFCPPFCSTNIPVTSEIRHHNGYLYSHIEQGELTWTTGLSIDDVTTQARVETQINPKLGLTWQVNNSTTLRAAAFRTMARSLVANQTVEPTQVAGFNQFFDDISGSDARRYGVALEKNLETFYLGVEVSKRNLEVPFLAAQTNKTFKAGWVEQAGRAYTYWTPLKWLAASAEYQYESFRRPATDSFDKRDGTVGIPDLTTQQLPLSINLFSTNGFTTNISATRVKQRGEFATAIQTGTTTTFSADQFWVFDTAVSFRLSNRLGRVTIGAKNLLDKAFLYHNSDIATTRLLPERTLFTHLSLSF